jgi:hypothetical protein
MFKKEKQTIRYDSKDKNLPYFDKTSEHIPKWWKDGNTFVPGIKPFENKAMKLCMPFLDALTIGYVIPTPCDIVVQVVDNKIKFIWPDGPFKIEKRNSSHNATIPTPAGHYQDQYTWSLNTLLELPKGYSALYTHPLNRHDLPFTSLSAIVDLDETVAEGALPFYLKAGFEGLIPQGTPFVQVIPFKRENWVSQEDDSLYNKAIYANNNTMSVLSGWYKKNRWHRKTFE